MAEYYTDISNYEDIADAIRAKNGEATLYRPGEMAQAILDIPEGASFQIFNGQIITNETYNSDLFSAVTGSTPAEVLTDIARMNSRLSVTTSGNLTILHFNDDATCGVCVDNTATYTQLQLYNNGIVTTSTFSFDTILYIFLSHKGFVFSDLPGTAPEDSPTRIAGVFIDKTNLSNTVIGTYGHIYKSGDSTNYHNVSAALTNAELPIYNNKYYNTIYPIIVNSSYDPMEHCESTFYNIANKLWSGGTYKFYNDEIEGVRSAGSSSYMNYINHIKKK